MYSKAQILNIIEESSQTFLPRSSSTIEPEHKRYSIIRPHQKSNAIRMGHHHAVPLPQPLQQIIYDHNPKKGWEKIACLTHAVYELDKIGFDPRLSRYLSVAHSVSKLENIGTKMQTGLLYRLRDWAQSGLYRSTLELLVGILLLICSSISLFSKNEERLIGRKAWESFFQTST